MKYYIFDFDGVVGDTYSSAVETNMGFYKIDEEQSNNVTKDFFNKPRVNSTSDQGIFNQSVNNLEDYNELHIRTILKNKATIFEGLIEILDVIDAKYAIVSSGHKGYISPMLENCKVVFNPVLDVNDDRSKLKKIKKVCEFWDVDIAQIKFFTDTTSDIIELENYIPNQMYGCTWGYHKKEKLKSVLNDNFLLDKFEDILKI
jgi:2-hydroxy-3-keto-5-methylthiopentenyl-1-phosphate phosphatase